MVIFYWDLPSENSTNLESLNQAAKPFGSVLVLPEFETSPEEMAQNMELAILVLIDAVVARSSPVAVAIDQGDVHRQEPKYAI